MNKLHHHRDFFLMSYLYYKYDSRRWYYEWPDRQFMSVEHDTGDFIIFWKNERLNDEDYK